MKKINGLLAILVVLAFVFSAAPARSQGGFILGLATGSLLFGDGDRTGGSAATVIYTFPEVSKRVKNPLAIRMVSIVGNFYYHNSSYIGKFTLQELFETEVKDPQKFEILQVVRVFHGSSPEAAAVWFAYTGKENLLPAIKP